MYIRLLQTARQDHFPPPIRALETARGATRLRRYVSEIVPMICEPGDDEQHGSSVVCDVSALQALSRRVHLGKFVAESKFQVHTRIFKFHRSFSAGCGGKGGTQRSNPFPPGAAFSQAMLLRDLVRDARLKRRALAFGRLKNLNS